MLNSTLVRVILVASSLVLATAPGCGDNDILDVDDAIDEGNRRGDHLADMADIELNGDAENILIAKAAAISLEIDQGQIALAQLALGAVAAPAIVAYADRMLADSQAQVRATNDLLASLGLLPLDNVIAGTLRNEYALAIDELGTSPNVDFTYMRQLVTFHQESYVVLGALVELAPSTLVAQFFAQAQLVVLDQLNTADAIFRAM